MKKSGFMQKVQRFGGAMFTPVLLFSFAGIMVSLAIIFKNQDIVGSLSNSKDIWCKIWYIIEQGAWTFLIVIYFFVFRYLIFKIYLKTLDREDEGKEAKPYQK